MAYEDAIYTRNSHYSYEIKNNKLRLFPSPDQFAFSDSGLDRVWVNFYVDQGDAWEQNGDTDDGVKGINNFNTIPFDNLPYENINSIGKQWIRKYALALCKEMLAHVRGKYITVPIPGESVTLNHSELFAQAKEEQEKLKASLNETLQRMRYNELVKSDAEVTEAAASALKQSPLPIFVG